MGLSAGRKITRPLKLSGPLGKIVNFVKVFNTLTRTCRGETPFTCPCVLVEVRMN